MAVLEVDTHTNRSARRNLTDAERARRERDRQRANRERDIVTAEQEAEAEARRVLADQADAKTPDVREVVRALAVLHAR